MSGNIQVSTPIDYSQYNTRLRSHENSSEINYLNKQPLYSILSEDALIADQSGLLPSQIMSATPELRSPKMTEQEKVLILAILAKSLIEKNKCNTDRPAGYQANTPTTALTEQNHSLKINKKNNFAGQDWSNLSPQQSKLLNQLIAIIRLLIKLKQADTENKNAGVTRQTAAAESSAKELVNSAKSSFTAAAIAGAASTGLTAGVMAKSGHTTHKHTKEHSELMDKKSNLQQGEKLINSARSNAGPKAQTATEKAEAAAACKNAEDMASTKDLQHDTDQDLFKSSEFNDLQRRRESGVLSLANPLHQALQTSLEIKATTQRAESNLLDNDRTVYQRSAENSAEMESRDHKVEQFVLDIALQLINNNISTNSAIISRAN